MEYGGGKPGICICFKRGVDVGGYNKVLRAAPKWVLTDN